MPHQNLAEEIVEKIGGTSNVESLTFCTTRLRFTLNDEDMAIKEEIQSIPGVLAVVESGGQIQIVIGQHVKQVYEPIQEILSKSEQKDSKLLSAKDKKEEMKSKKISNKIFSTVSGVFTPILGLLSATGILKGLLVFLTATNIIDVESGTYEILNIVVNSFFTFMPVFLGYTAMKKFGGTPFIGMAIGAAFVFPTIAPIMEGEALYTLFEGSLFQTPVFLEFLGLPVILMNYQSSVFPVILTSFFAAGLEKKLTKALPNFITFFAVPALTLLVSIVLGFLLIGPIATFLGNGLGLLALKIYNFSPTLSGFLYGLLIQFFVIFGLHWGFITVSINNLATLGYDAFTVAGMASVFGQAGVILYIWKKTKDAKLKQISGTSFISAIFGITEPGIYGVTVQNKRAFMIASLASGVGGAIIGFFRTKLYVYGPGGVFGWLQVIPQSGVDITVYATIISFIVTFVLAYALMAVFGNYKDEDMYV